PFTAPPTSAIYPLSLHDALPILHDFARHGMDVDGLERERLRRRRREARERARDRVQPVDFGQDPPGRLGERRVEVPAVLLLALRDRKSTRLNSSHVSISYAVFCL